MSEQFAACADSLFYRNMTRAAEKIDHLILSFHTNSSDLAEKFVVRLLTCIV
jgi:hypothetical protein